MPAPVEIPKFTGCLKANEEGGGLLGMVFYGVLACDLSKGRWCCNSFRQSLGRNPDREVRVFGAQSGKASNRTQGRNGEAEIEEEDAKATRNRWTGKLGKHLAMS